MCTKFGGRPYIPQGREWPVCHVSGDPLLFLCQLVARDSPFGLAMEDPDTMLQFFTRADATVVVEEPYGNNVFARLIRAPDRYPAPPNADIPPAATLLKSATISRWDEYSDHPDREEQECFVGEVGGGYCGGSDGHMVSFPAAAATAGIKLGGWPYWVRNARCFRQASNYLVPQPASDEKVANVSIQCRFRLDRCQSATTVLARWIFCSFSWIRRARSSRAASVTAALHTYSNAATTRHNSSCSGKACDS